MAGSGSKLSIYGAIAANLGIAISKFIAGAYTGSSAMVSEGIHSLVDTANGGLLLYGIRRSERPPNTSHPFGYGMEVYFWSFVVSILIFALGGGIAIYEGIHHLMFPVQVENMKVNLIVLGLAILFESGSLYVALKEFRKSHGSFNLYRSIRRSKDSSTFAIIIEDIGAMIGLVVAFFGLLLGQIFDWPFADGGASVVIGLLLTAMAIFLAIETKGLLLGESMDEDSVKKVQLILEKSSLVKDFGLIRSVHFGPIGVMLGVDVQFERGNTLEELEEEIDRLELAIKSEIYMVKHVYLEPRKELV
jgi:cation diffusion facilitator family transporter